MSPTTQYFFQKENAKKEAHQIHLASKLLTSYFHSADGYGNSVKANTNSTNVKFKVPSILTSAFKFSSEPTKITISFYYFIATSSNSSFSSFYSDFFSKKNMREKSGKIGVDKKFMKNPNVKKLTVQQKYELSQLSVLLSTLFGKQVDICITQLHYPYIESTILAQYLCYNATSSTFLHFQEAILSYPSLHLTNLPSSITGVKIQLCGRILTESVVPRLTVKSAFVGTFSRSSHTSYDKHTSSFSIDYGTHTTKNQLGSFTIKVWIASNSNLVCLYR